MIGSGRFSFADPALGAGAAMSVHYHCPDDVGADAPIVFLLHGLDRAAAFFRDCWVEHAERFGFVVVAPEFDAARFPDIAHYNYGNVRAPEHEGGSFEARERWTFLVLDRLFPAVREAVGSRRTTFSLFGHSAGAQFVHRYVALTGGALVDLAVCGNAGWYMMPDRGLPYPAGLGGLAVSDDDLRAYLAKPIVLLLGEADNDPAGIGLPSSPAAAAQGPHRLARGRYYFEFCRREAERVNAAFAWRLVTVPGVGHGDREIAAPAAELIAGAHRQAKRSGGSAGRRGRRRPD